MTDPTQAGPPAGEGPKTAKARQWVEGLAEGELVSEVYGVLAPSEKLGGTGRRVMIGDATGRVTLITWNLARQVHGAAVQGTAIHVYGEFAVHPQFDEQITVKEVRPAEKDEYDPLDLYPKSPTPIEELNKQFKELIHPEDGELPPHLLNLVERMLCTGEEADLWRNAPATLDDYFAYRHGAFELAVKSARVVSPAARIHGWNHPLAVICALVKGFGVVEVFEPLHIGFGLVDDGELAGGAAVPGYCLVREAIRDIPDFPAEDATALKHAMLADEEGTAIPSLMRMVKGVSDIVEATAAGGRFDQLEREAPKDSKWSRPSKWLGGQAYLGDRSA